MKTFTQFFFEDNLPKDGQWITSNGKHIFLSKSGKMLAGVPKELIGKDVEELKNLEDKLNSKEKSKELKQTKTKDIKTLTDFNKAVKSSAKKLTAHKYCKPEKASEASLASLGDYTREYYKDINRSLRHLDDFKTTNKEYPEHIKYIEKSVKNIRKLFDENRTSKDMTVFRGLKSGSARLKDLQPGDIFVDKGFMSTTSDSTVTSAFSNKSSAQMKILVPKGSRAISTLDVTKYPDEEEVLLGDNSNLKFVGLEDDGTTYCFQLVN